MPRALMTINLYVYFVNLFSFYPTLVQNSSTQVVSLLVHVAADKVIILSITVCNIVETESVYINILICKVYYPS